MATTKKNREGLRARLRRLSGKWKIVEMPDFDDDYLSESKNPHIQLAFRGKSGVSGHYEYGLCNGELDGEVIENDEGRALEIRFSFEGYDEMEEENGYGEAVFSEGDKTLTGKLHVHMGDTWRLVCRRK